MDLFQSDLLLILGNGCFKADGMEKRRGELLVPLNVSEASLAIIENDGWAALLYPIASLPFTFLVLVETGEPFRF